MTQVTVRPQTDIVRKVLEYPTPVEVIEKYVDKYELTEEVAREHERELERYLAMCLANPEAAYGMFGPVDEFWHTWILFTREWWEFSETVAGHYLHHRPTTRQEKKLVRTGAMLSAYGCFLADYPVTSGKRRRLISGRVSVKLWRARTVLARAVPEGAATMNVPVVVHKYRA